MSDRAYIHAVTFALSHSAETFIQSDLQDRSSRAQVHQHEENKIRLFIVNLLS